MLETEEQMGTDKSDLFLSFIEKRRVAIGVIGLGYVGLPLAMRFAQSGFNVLGYDTDTKKIGALHQGESYIDSVSDGDLMREVSEIGKFLPTWNPLDLCVCQVFIVCVPTPLGPHQEADLTYITDSTKMVSSVLKESASSGLPSLIILESTTYPGTTEEVMLPILDESKRDFWLAFSPEREDPGNPLYHTQNIPKVVGGLGAESVALATKLYEQAIDTVVPVSCLKTAEMTKILENIFRSVNIALINELKMVCDKMGIDIWEVIEAASTKPFGFMPFYPGPGLGGHCIPIDPFYLTWKAKEFGVNTRFIELAGQINSEMPHYVVQKTIEALNEKEKPIKGSSILVLGVAYKPDVGDLRESPALKIIEILLKMGAKVQYTDPHAPEITKQRKYPGWELYSQEISPKMLLDYDCAIMVTDHKKFDLGLIGKYSRLIVDTRNAFHNVQGNKIKKA